MKPEYLMKWAWYKYKNLLDKEGWEAPDEQHAQIINLRMEIKLIKIKRTGNRKKCQPEKKGHGKSNIPVAANNPTHKSKINYS